MTIPCYFQSFGIYDFVQPERHAIDSGVVFERSVNIPPGRHGWLVQMQADIRCIDELREIMIEIIDARTGERLCESRIGRDDAPISIEMLDDIVLTTASSVARSIFVRGIASGGLNHVRLRHLKVIGLGETEPLREAFADADAILRTDWLKAVFIGATNVCNANCPHCPTNKKMTSHLARGHMDIQLFRKLMEQLKDVTIGDGILFGVFGEPFADPLLEDRIKTIREFHPSTAIDIATNGELADPARVRAILDHVRSIAIHVEACSPELYDKLMWPLKASTMFPRIEELLSIGRGRIFVTTPLHAENCHEAPALRHRWERDGNRVQFSSLQTRATERTLARRAGLALTAGFWTANLLDILVVDWDGTVLTTCDDFLRRQPLGNLNDQDVADILASDARKKIFENLRRYRWTELPSIYDSMIDDPRATQSYAVAGIESPPRWMSVAAFRTINKGNLQGSVIKVSHDPSRAHDAAVFGPYLKLERGRYIARFKGRAGTAKRLALRFEVVSGFGHRVLGELHQTGAMLANLDLPLEFSHVAADELLEFRIFVLDGSEDESFEFEGVTLSSLGH
jgi:sulfatase maturation enzyme AslB (radical SAM superfamily)